MESVLPPNPDVVGVARHLRAQVRPILTYPNDTLHTMSEKVTEFDDELGQLIMDMFYTMDTNKGVGLAAPQIGVNKRVVTLSIPYKYMLKQEGTENTEYTDSHQKHTVLINPEVTDYSDEIYTFEEGCLSVPGYYENRKRPTWIIVQYQTPKGNIVHQQFEGLSAFTIQHEIDHLNGKLFIDKLSPLKKQRIKKKVIKTLKQSR